MTTHTTKLKQEKFHKVPSFRDR